MPEVSPQCSQPRPQARLDPIFCTTYPALITIGDIFLWGTTAALAFELPQDPYSPFNHKADPLHRRMDTKTIYFTDYNGKIIHQEPYKRKFIVNPAFAKRSVDGSDVAQEYKIDRRNMHASKHTRKFLKGDYMENVGFHRRGRATLYQHIEGLLQGLGVDGRVCLLKMLCEMGHSNNDQQGAFLQEIMRVVFTLPKSSNLDDVDVEYDAAHSAKGSCEELYPCTGKGTL
ncbi:jg27899 [Pararge aegeria aegeria]|uniref:Jg27899 protein n=1 Tax=Pararge aegeria aegeria TaxID=348720 RepID=A0A8S4SKD0_9NEOP|nr:jg27899 [Pararge aegeria aegeria]